MFDLSDLTFPDIDLPTHVVFYEVFEVFMKFYEYLKYTT